jgi:hypothetical protein
MRKLSLLLCLLFLLSLWGCQAQPADLPTIEVPTSSEPPSTVETASPAEPSEIPDEIPSEVPSQNLVNAPALAEGPEGSLVLVLTDFFSLTLPHDWANTCVYTTAYRDDGAYLVSLYEAGSYKEFGGGCLCTLMLLPTGEDYTIFPSYQFLGALNTPDSTFNLVALFPTDVQFTPETMETYNRMTSELPDVLSTLNPANEVELALP